MSYELVKANLNLYAVLKNFEDLVALDKEMADLIRDWNEVIQFKVIKGPCVYLDFKNGHCRVGKGMHQKPTIKLLFVTPSHLNKVMDGSGVPIPVKGLTKLKLLTGGFDKLSKKLEYYLKPTDELLRDKTYFELNTRFLLTTAAYAMREIGLFDPVGELVAPHIRNGDVSMKVLPDGPAVNINFMDGEINVSKGEVEKPMALMTMKNMQVANDFLNNKIDTFSAVASGSVIIKGQISMIDSMSLILNRIPQYLS